MKQLNSILFRFQSQKTAAFTLVELLIVMTIIAVLAVIGLPALKGLNRTGGMTGAYQQLLDDISRARHLAMVNRTTVYMVFVPPDLDRYMAGNPPLNAGERQMVTNLLVGQFTAYNFVSLRSVGDQPGRGQVKYLDKWQFLPEGIFIPPDKFTNTVRTADDRIEIKRFNYSNKIPFPLATSNPFAWRNYNNPEFEGLPYIAFNPQGQLQADSDALIPLTLGSILYSRDEDGKPEPGSPEVYENPPGNARTSYNLIQVNRVTGRGRYVKRELE